LFIEAVVFSNGSDEFMSTPAWPLEAAGFYLRNS
jgi:hypothetical protein